MEYRCVVFQLEYQGKEMVCQEGKVSPGIPYILIQTLKIPKIRQGKANRNLIGGMVPESLLSHEKLQLNRYIWTMQGCDDIKFV